MKSYDLVVSSNSAGTKSIIIVHCSTDQRTSIKLELAGIKPPTVEKLFFQDGSQTVKATTPIFNRVRASPVSAPLYLVWKFGWDRSSLSKDERPQTLTKKKRKKKETQHKRIPSCRAVLRVAALPVQHGIAKSTFKWVCRYSEQGGFSRNLCARIIKKHQEVYEMA